MITDTIYAHLSDVYKTKVKSLKSPAITVDPSYTVSRVINEISKNGAYGVFYHDGKSVLTTDIRTLLAGKNITKMTIEPFLYTIRSLTLNDTVQNAANIMAHYRIREVPIVENKKIIGVVSAKKILKLLAKKDNRWIKANLIYTQNPITTSSKEPLSTARKIMLSKKIDHLPVLSNDNVKQVLTSYHLLRAIIPRESLGRKSMGMEKIRKLESNVGNIGSTRVPQCSPNDDLNHILDSMLKTDTTCCMVNLWNNLQGIITYRDILSLLAAKMESDVPLYIVGMPDDQKNVDLITSKFTNTLKRLQKVYSEIQEAKVSIKQQRSGSKKEGKYEISIMITTPHHGPQIYKDVGFDLSMVIESLSQKLLRNLSKRAKRRFKPTIRKRNLPISPL